MLIDTVLSKHSSEKQHIKFIKYNRFAEDYSK